MSAEVRNPLDMEPNGEVLAALAACGVDTPDVRWCEECGFFELHDIPSDKVRSTQICLTDETRDRETFAVHIRDTAT